MIHIMKTGMKTLALGLLMMFGTLGLQAQSSKVGHINVDELITLMPETKAAEQSLQVLKILDGIYRSQKAGSEVRLD